MSLRKPAATDGPAVSALIAASPPLDANSAYCNLLQCTDFADSCAAAECDGALVGWVSGYRVPQSPETLFVWQVAIAASMRGHGLAGRMIEALLARPQQHGVTHVTTTITQDNRASWALFEGLARRWNAPIEKTARFEREPHFAGAHATEWQARLGPLPHLAAATQEGTLTA
ncbi:diaminobutyrate acetyltransferase [Sphingobium sp. B11D3B]|uniref:diaminobutyrate acetyltransferase n=1 Tax=Sphingobium sp. B11D3B TaxID=2940575 RepID=UPI002226FFAF|nr:diaminobutyrate acetyltransferase [Sphingobium sp. B11D3B]